MKNAERLVISVAVLSTFGLTGCGGKAPDPNDIRWGNAVNGLQAGLSIKSIVRKPKPMLTLKFHIRNVGDEPIRIWKLSSQSDSWGHCPPVEVRVDGKLRSYEGLVFDPNTTPPAISDFPYLNSGHSDTEEERMYPEYWGVFPPFDAEIVFVFKNLRKKHETVAPFDHEKRKWSTVDGLWTGAARSGPVRVSMH